MAATLDFGSFSSAEKTALLTSAKAELLRRAGVGAVETGSSAAQSFGMLKMSMEELTLLINSLSQELGYAQAENRVMPNFARPTGTFYAE